MKDKEKMTLRRHKIHVSGPGFSPLVWGAWRALEAEETNSPAKLARLIEGCLELGITTFDHADIYGMYQTEALFGAALRQSGIARESIELVSKCGILIGDRAKISGAAPERFNIKHYDTSAAYIARAVDMSLKALGTDYLDLLLIHRPDPFMDADETAGALKKLVASGKVRHLGVSNHSPSQLDLLQSRLDLPLVTNQIECSVLHTQALHDGTLDQAQQMRAAPMIWSPLGGGDLFRGTGPRHVRLRQVLERIGRGHGADIGQVALAWLLAHPARPVPVLGTSALARIKHSLKALDVTLSRVDWFEILAASEGTEVP